MTFFLVIYHTQRRLFYRIMHDLFTFFLEKRCRYAVINYIIIQYSTYKIYILHFHISYAVFCLKIAVPAATAEPTAGDVCDEDASDDEAATAADREAATAFVVPAADALEDRSP